MTIATADAILNTLHAFHLVDEGGGKWRCNSPIRPGSNSHAFCLKIDGPEHGTWFDQVTGESGSLYELAAALGIATPQQPSAPVSSKRAYTGLADYAQAHGAQAGAYAAWGWAEATHQGRPALTFPTAHGPRWRFLDGGKPPFTSSLGYTPCWYGLAEAVVLAQASGQPLVLCNGEASVVAAQSWGVAACCITNSGERELPDPLLQQLQGAWTGAILIALDCDKKGRDAAPKLAAQVGGQVVDLGGADGFDLADFCHLHQGGAIAELVRRAIPGVLPTGGGAGAHTVSARILAALASAGYQFRLNLLVDEIEVGGELMTDVMRAQIRTTLRDMGIGPIGAVDDTIVTEAAAHAYHPIREYLDSLAWDGVARFEALAACLNGTDAPMRYADGRSRPLIELYLTRWLIGAVAKVYEQAQNMMLVFVGPQGAGKSTFARWLAGRMGGQYFIEAPINVADKDTDVRLMSAWIWEVGELDATTRKQDVAALKDFITRKIVTVRKSYGRHDLRKPALASLLGTVNDGDGFLNDTTGNRRFLVVNIGQIDLAYQQIDMDQVWAEACARYRAGEAWRLDSEESAYQHAVNRQHEVEDPIDGWLDRYFWVDPSDTIGMTIADIIDVLRARDVPINADRAWATRIGAALRKRGLVARQVRMPGDWSVRARRYYGLVKASM